MKGELFVCVGVVPGVAFVVDLLVGPLVGERDGAGVWGDVGESVEEVGEVRGRNGRGRVFARIYAPVDEAGLG